MEGAIVTTYRCNAECYMCNTWQYPSSTDEEIDINTLEKLPNNIAFYNVTGGEPFLREDIEEIISVLNNKSKRIVISTNGYFTDRIIRLSKRYPNIGIRVSLEGLPAANDELRGIPDGFDHGLRTILELRHMGVKDIGFGITVSDRNAKDMFELLILAHAMDLEFASSVTHNSFYFHKHDNEFQDPEAIAEEFRKVIRKLFNTYRLKNWFRAYYNHYLINKVMGGPRPLPCECGTDVFFLDPFGKIRPCNGRDVIMGDLKEQSFEEIWNGDQAQRVRELVASCDRHCWMTGSAAPAMKKSVFRVARWILTNRGRYLHGERVPMFDREPSDPEPNPSL